MSAVIAKPRKSVTSAVRAIATKALKADWHHAAQEAGKGGIILSAMMAAAAVTLPVTLKVLDAALFNGENTQGMFTAIGKALINNAPALLAAITVTTAATMPALTKKRSSRPRNMKARVAGAAATALLGIGTFAGVTAYQDSITNTPERPGATSPATLTPIERLKF